MFKTTVTTSHTFKILYLPVKGFDRPIRESAVIDPAGTVFLNHYKGVDDRITEPRQEAGKVNKDLIPRFEVEIDQVFDLFPGSQRMPGISGIELDITLFPVTQIPKPRGYLNREDS